jgi:DnaJ-class molecular chaperone
MIGSEQSVIVTEQVCISCEGFGWSLWDGSTCQECGGSGTILTEMWSGLDAALDDADRRLGTL